jgi:hypothetical protein
MQNVATNHLETSCCASQPAVFPQALTKGIVCVLRQLIPNAICQPWGWYVGRRRKTLTPPASPRGERLHPEVIHLRPKLRAMEAEIFASVTFRNAMALQGSPSHYRQRA